MLAQNKAHHAKDVHQGTTSAFSKSPTEGKDPQSASSFSSLFYLFIYFTVSRKHEVLTRSLRKMERTLDTVLRTIGNPSIASGMISRSPSPSAQAAGTQALLAQSPSPSPAPTFNSHPSANNKFNKTPPGSPKLHSLPDNSLNPLGLLAEASLANRRAQAINNANSGIVAKLPRGDEKPKLGVASDNYFKPGTLIIRDDDWCFNFIYQAQ